METVRSEGIILQSLPVKDFDLIITAFTRECGVLKFYYKNGQSRRRSKGAVTSPLTCAEFLFYRRNSDLNTLSDISVIDVHVDLRNTLEKLEYSCNWLQLILKSQLQGKPSPDLYSLFRTYLKALQYHINPQALHCSFYLKLLRHEGLVELTSQCSVCGQPSTCQDSQSFCKIHSPYEAIAFSLNEYELLDQLACCKTLKQLEAAEVSQSFIEKIETLYTRLSS